MEEDFRSRSFGLLKNVFVFHSAKIDSFVFRLHYKLTFAILLALSVLAGWRQHFGTTISCTASHTDLPAYFVNEYCYVHSTYSKKESWNKTVGEEIPYPGVDKQQEGVTKIYHTYYQWVSLVLFVQALFFLVPRCFWKHMESGRVQDIIKGIDECGSANSDHIRQQNTYHLSRRLRSQLYRNWKYFLCYIATAVLNLVNVIVHIHLMNVFLGGQFSYFGHQVLQFSRDWSWISNQDPGLRLFPRMTMCEFFQYSRGEVQKHTALCMLPMNILHEKIYAFLWFWFIFLAIVSCFPLITLALFCLSMRFRIVSLVVNGRWRLLEVEHVRRIVSVCNAPDCFLIRLVSQNLNSETFRDLVMNIIEEYSKITENEMKEIEIALAD